MKTLGFEIYGDNEIYKDINGDGRAINVENFGWGKVNRCYPQISNIYIENNRIKFANVITEKSEYYTRIYHYIGKNEE